MAVGGFVKEGAMRAVSCLPYILPMMDSLAYGRFLFQKVPLLAVIFMKPLQPFIDAAQAFPVSSELNYSHSSVLVCVIQR